jgi:hypothetical protein
LHAAAILAENSIKIAWTLQRHNNIVIRRNSRSMPDEIT